MAELNNKNNKLIGNQRQPRYSIRKLTIGAASCLVGYFLFMPNTTVKAAEQPAEPAAAAEQTTAAEANSTSDNKIELTDKQAEISLPGDLASNDSAKKAVEEQAEAPAADQKKESEQSDQLIEGKEGKADKKQDQESQAAKDKDAKAEAAKEPPAKARPLPEEEAGSILVVGDGENDYDTLHDAVGYASDGDTISIEKDVHENETTIIDKNVTLIGKNKEIVFDNSCHLEIGAGQNVVFGSANSNQGVTVRSKTEFDVRGHLTTNDSFTYVCDNADSEMAKLKVLAGGRLDVEGGTFSPAYVEYERGSTGSIHGGTFFNNLDLYPNTECLFIDGDVSEITGGFFHNDFRDDGDLARAAVYIQGHVGRISGGTFLSEKSNALHVIHGGYVDEISGGTFTCHDQKGFALALMSYQNEPVSYVGKISGGTFNGGRFGAWLYSYGAPCYIGDISGGTFTGSQAGVQNDVGSRIGKISGGTFKADSAGLLNVSQIDEISGGQFSGRLTGGLWNYDARARISLIDGGTFSGASGINNKGQIDRIAGGNFTGQTFAGLWNKGTINVIDNGRFMGHRSGIYNDDQLSQIKNGLFWGQLAYGIDNQSETAIALEPDLVADSTGLGIGRARYWGEKDALHGEFVLPGDYHMSSRSTVLPVAGISDTKFRFLKEFLTLSYDPNGGTGAVNSQTETEDSHPLTIADNGFARLGYQFSGWNTKADGRGTAYQPGDAIVLTQNTTLYAQWKAEEKPPKPDVPDIPDIPDLPDIPDQPEKPTEPEQPTEPDQPDQPSQPGEPGNSEPTNDHEQISKQTDKDKIKSTSPGKTAARQSIQEEARLPQTGEKSTVLAAALCLLLGAGLSLLAWRREKE